MAIQEKHVIEIVVQKIINVFHLSMAEVFLVYL